MTHKQAIIDFITEDDLNDELKDLASEKGLNYVKDLILNFGGYRISIPSVKRLDGPTKKYIDSIKDKIDKGEVTVSSIAVDLDYSIYRFKDKYIKGA